MPYPTEHAARIRDPGLFIPESFRSKDLKDGVRIILGKLKTGGSNMVTQAYRFSIENFTPEQARQWLKDNKVAFKKFEPAKEEVKTNENMDNELKHVGVLGMRWGVRRSRSGSGSSRRAKRSRTESADYKAVKKIRKKHHSELSDDELKKVTKRLELEKRYKDLNPDTVTRGKRSVDSTFATIGKMSAAVASATGLILAGKKIYDFASGRMRG